MRQHLTDNALQMRPVEPARIAVTPAGPDAAAGAAVRRFGDAGAAGALAGHGGAAAAVPSWSSSPTASPTGILVAASPPASRSAMPSCSAGLPADLRQLDPDRRARHPRRTRLAVGYPIAYFLAFRAGRRAPLLLALLLIPFWVDFMIRMSSWMVLMGRNGLINAGLAGLGLTDEPIRMLGTYPAVVVGMLYALPPHRGPADLRLAQHHRQASPGSGQNDLGAGPIEAFWRTTFPLSLPGVMAAILFVFVPAMGVYAVPGPAAGRGQEHHPRQPDRPALLEFRSTSARRGRLGDAARPLLDRDRLYMRLLRRIEEASA